MKIINRIKFYHTPETSSLYLKCNEGASLNYNADKVEVVFTKNGFVSFNTYFNSFYETFYAKYTKLESLYYLLKFQGDFQVSLYRECSKQENRELIYKQNCENCQLAEPVKILLPNSWRSEEAGRVYLEVTCLSKHGLFTEGYIATEENPIIEVSLGIISCTFKKEAFIKKTVNTILQDDLLNSKNFKVFVVDNAKTITNDEFKDERVELIPNRNVGGAGGFTRGLIQAMQNDACTHFLFMDDDIDLEGESVYRLFSLYEYANQDISVAGSMLDLYKKNKLYESGALYAKYFDGNGNMQSHPFTIIPLNNKLNLEESKSLNFLLSEDKPDYGAFWFFSFSKQTVQEMGLPMPFFIRMDDIEFSLRIRETLNKIILAFPGIAVWHEPFYAKNPIWTDYYEIRNKLIVHSTRNSLSYTEAIKFLTKMLLHKLLIFDYNSSVMFIKGFEDYLKGPLSFKKIEPERLHSELLNISKTYPVKILPSASPVGEKLNNTSDNNKIQLIKKIKKIFALLTLNGHLLPSFLLSKDNSIFWITSDFSDWWPQVFPKKQVVFFREGQDCVYSVYEHEINQGVGIGLLIRWLKLVITSAIKWSSVSSEWRNSFKDLTSIEFWKEYLKINEQVEQPAHKSMVN
ncbi:MAG: glycosyltransferase [Nostochopsis sp.]